MASSSSLFTLHIATLSSEESLIFLAVDEPIPTCITLSPLSNQKLLAHMLPFQTFSIILWLKGSSNEQANTKNQARLYYICSLIPSIISCLAKNVQNLIPYNKKLSKIVSRWVSACLLIN